MKCIHTHRKFSVHREIFINKLWEQTVTRVNYSYNLNMAEQNGATKLGFYVE